MNSSEALKVFDNIIEKLDEIRKEKDLTYLQIAERAKVDKNTVFKTFRHGKRCNLLTFIKLCYAIEVDFIDLIRKGYGRI